MNLVCNLANGKTKTTTYENWLTEFKIIKRGTIHFWNHWTTSYEIKNTFIRNHKIESVDTPVVDFESSQRELEVTWNQIAMVWRWFKSYEVYWNHLKLCAVDDIIKLWNHLYTQTGSEWPLVVKGSLNFDPTLLRFFSKGAPQNQ